MLKVIGYNISLREIKRLKLDYCEYKIVLYTSYLGNK
jgi:hypothetical protein